MMEFAESAAGFGSETEHGPKPYGAFVLDPDGDNVEAVCRTA